MTGPRVAWAVLIKDLLLDLRSGDRLGHMMLFAAVVSTLLGIALPAVAGPTRQWVPTLLWIVFLLSSLLGLSRSFQAELDGAALLSLAQVPCERGWVFLGKAAATWLTLAGLELWTALLFGLFLKVPWLRGLPTRETPTGAGVDLLALGGLMLLGAAGLSVVGTLFSAISSSVRNREFMLPLLLLPSTLPVLVIGSHATLEALEGRTIPSVLFGMMGLYTWVALLAGYFCFGYLLED